ncbi:MAG: hypothetical protein LBM64_02310 [Deltaproteobacteria bacterium]|nr:hypothetical protein [Deltaproteobacteria bacterium]
MPATPDAACIEVSHIDLAGVTVIPASEIERLIPLYAGRCLTLADINNLLRDITNLYIDKGYVTTRAFVAPEQDLTGGIKVMVIEGRVEKIILNEGDKNYYWHPAWKGNP